MAEEIEEFPDLTNKLAAPVKKSLFEKQKAEAAEKRAREAADTKAAYEDFVKSFEGSDDEGDALSRMAGQGRGGRGGLGSSRGGFASSSVGRRHFTTGPPSRTLNSGPGSLGPAPSLHGRKRPFDEDHHASRDPRQRGILGFEDERGAAKESRSAKAAFRAEEDEENSSMADVQAAERAAPKPTIQLTHLPADMSPAAIKALLPANLVADFVRILPASSQGYSERGSKTAIITLAKDTPASDIDAAVSLLQNRYLGYGFYLNLSRHLSSAALGASLNSITQSTTAKLPFGAKLASTGVENASHRGPPPSSFRGNFAPPSSYDSAQNRATTGVHVKVVPPKDIRQLKLIHQTVEQLIIHGPEFEALLMSRPSVQQDEKWAWLWDARSVGGVWYRWRIWQILTGSGYNKQGRDAFELLFDVGAPWQLPTHEDMPRFEFATNFEEFVSGSEYDSSEEDDSDDEGRRKKRQERSGRPPEDSSFADDQDISYLNPLQKAKLVHLLARMPTTTGTLRKGDVARVTAFAISHAGSGAEEVADIITSNVKRPLAWTGANADRGRPLSRESKPEDDSGHMDIENGQLKSTESEDQTPSKLIALYLISDILSCSSTSGVRHAWKYRQLFESALKAHNTFEALGRLEKELKWGKMRGEKWKRSVNGVLHLWEGWCVFPQKAHDEFVTAFNDPPLTAAERAAEGAREAEKRRAEKATRSKWRTVETAGAGADVDGEPMALDDQTALQTSSDVAEASKRQVDTMNLDGVPMDESDVDGVPMDDAGDDVDGEPMDDADEADPDGEPMATPKQATAAETIDKDGVGVQGQDNPGSSSRMSNAAPVRRQRPRAVDMFADSDGE